MSRRKKYAVIKVRGGIKILCFIIVGMTFWRYLKKDNFPDQIDSNTELRVESSTDGSSQNKSLYTTDYLTKLQEMAQTNAKVGEVLNHSEEYPEDVLELLANNEETIDFVLDYPEKNNLAPADSIGDINTGQIPLLIQWDERWGYTPYGDGILAVTGCGPTALAMVASGLTGDDSITPHKVAEYADENGYYVTGSGSSWNLMSDGGAEFGIQGQELTLSEETIFSELEMGHPIICSMRQGNFTTTGHFIVLKGIEQGKVQINDPNSKKRSSQLWDYDSLKPQISNLWSYTLL